MAITVKSASESAQKWRDRASGASSEYASGAAEAAEEWERNAVAAAPNFRAAIQQGNIEQRYESGVRRAGASKYRRKIMEVGASRYGSGIAAAESDYAEGVEPYLATIANLTLPPRQPRGSSANLERVAVIAQALHRRRVGSAAAGR